MGLSEYNTTTTSSPGKIEDVIRSKDGKVRKVIIGYKFDTEQGDRIFWTVERLIRECVKLFSLEDTTIFEDIAEVRAASQKILSCSVQFSSVPHNGWNSSSWSSHGCNSVLSVGSVYSSAVDVGYGVPGVSQDVSRFADEVAAREREIGVDLAENEIYFMIKNDTYDNYDKNDELYLL